MNELKCLLKASILNKCVNYFCPWLYLLKYLQENNLQYELQSALNNSTVDIYADDTTLSLSANWNNITSLTQALSNNLENIEKWSTENNMYINTEKSKALVVTGKRLQHKLSEETATLKLYALMPQILTNYRVTSYWV